MHSSPPSSLPPPAAVVAAVPQSALLPPHVARQHAAQQQPVQQQPIQQQPIQQQSAQQHAPQVPPAAPALLVASDVTGPALHAQGPRAGRRAALVRLGGCNLSCAWCDTPWTWDSGRFQLSSTLAQWPAALLAEHALAIGAGLVVIGGGEPLLQQRAEAWPLLLRLLQGVEVGLETNGTIPASAATLEGTSWITVSPKLAHSGDPAWARIHGEVLIDWGRQARQHDIDFSFVVKDAADVDTVRSLAAIHDLPRERVWITPEGVDARRTLAVLPELVEAGLREGFNVAPRVTALLQGLPAWPADPQTGSFPVPGRSAPARSGAGPYDAAPAPDRSSGDAAGTLAPEPGTRTAPVGARFPRSRR